MRLIDADVLMNKFGFSDADVIAKERIREAPTIDAKPVVYSKWVPVSGSYEKYYCLACEGTDTNCSDYYGSHAVLDQEYCPWCGAKMNLKES